MNKAWLAGAIMKRLDRHRGRGKAVPREIIKAELSPMLPVRDGDRAFRAAYAKLPICSCPDGLFIPEKPEEVEEFKRYLTAKSGPFVASSRVKIIYAARPELIPVNENQMGLF